MTPSEINEISKMFLMQAYQKSNGDPTVQVSMYEIGETLELDRDSASRVAEELMGQQLIEIRTLSGGVGLSAGNMAEIQNLTGLAGSAPDTAGFRLSDKLILDQEGHNAVEGICTELKSQAGKLGLDFDTLSEIMADVKTIDAQLDSSRPKTAILMECFRSIKSILSKIDNRDILLQINALLEG